MSNVEIPDASSVKAEIQEIIKSHNQQIIPLRETQRRVNLQKMDEEIMAAITSLITTNIARSTKQLNHQDYRDIGPTIAVEVQFPTSSVLFEDINQTLQKYRDKGFRFQFISSSYNCQKYIIKV